MDHRTLTVLVVAGVGVFFGSFLFPRGWKIAWAMLSASIKVIKWLMIVGFLAAAFNLPQLYSLLGWTPLSLLFGHRVYDQSLRELGLPDPHPEDVAKEQSKKKH